MKHLKLFETYEEEPWWKEFTKYQLNAYPVNIPKEDVQIDLSGDIDTHPVMTWRSPKTGKKVYAYTKARMDAQSDKKYERIGNLTDKEVRRIKARAHDDIISETTSDKTKQLAAIICIIAETGLRPGSRKGFLETENRGVVTLSPENIEIDGPKIMLNFMGKSYKENTAKINDGVLANYIATRIEEDEDGFVFDVKKNMLDRYYKKQLGMADFKIKDLRTYIAGKIAKMFLRRNKVDVSNAEPKEIKKIVKSTLKKTFEHVSMKLNNSPAMARGSYVNPVIINEWLDSIGVTPQLMTEGTPEEMESPKRFDGDAPVYDMPNWWDNDEINLVKE